MPDCHNPLYSLLKKSCYLQVMCANLPAYHVTMILYARNTTVFSLRTVPLHTYSSEHFVKGMYAFIDINFYLLSLPRFHVWQARVVIDYYSVVYFTCVTVFKVLYLWTSDKGGVHTRCRAASIAATFTQHVWAPPLTEVQRYSALNAVMSSKYAIE